jgi:glucosamine 6-phosphate synthetase-like amidotransferase/phosphosugar isomerase protein
MRLGERGVHIQRWLEPPTVVRHKESKALQKYYTALKHQQNEAGNRSEGLDAIAIHGRFATCARTLNNVHPFYKDGTALMHNGVIHNAEKFDLTLSTCDSEALLSQYVKHNVKKNPLNLTDALDGVGGYYAAIVFNDNGNIDIWRDETATLFMAHVKNVGVVIATTSEIIVKTSKKCRAYISGIDEILPGISIRWTEGHSPRISQYEANKPVTFEAIGATATDIIEAHKASVSDAHWFEEADYPRHFVEKEDQYLAEWQRQEDEDNKRIAEMQEKMKVG